MVVKNPLRLLSRFTRVDYNVALVAGVRFVVSICGRSWKSQTKIIEKQIYLFLKKLEEKE